MSRKLFKYGDRVKVKVPGRRSFIGTVYSEYKPAPNKMRLICVEQPGGAGVAYLVRYVKHVKP